MIESAPLTNALISPSGVLTITVIHFLALENSMTLSSWNLISTGRLSLLITFLNSMVMLLSASRSLKKNPKYRAAFTRASSSGELAE